MNANEYQKLAMRTNDREATKRLLESMLTCDMKYLLSQNLVFEDEQHLDLGGIFNACSHYGYSESSDCKCNGSC